MRRATAVITLMLATACGSDGSPRPWDVDEAGEAQEPGADAMANEADDCRVDTDCGDDSYCFRPPTCGAARYCVEGDPPYSAAPPVAACGCDGRRISVGHGYPGPHAWELGELAGWDTQLGPCDPDATAPFDYVIRFRILDELPEDGVMLARLSESLETDERVREVGANGVVEFRATGDQWARFSIVLLNDHDGDGVCGVDADTAYGTYTAEFEADLETFEIDIAVELQSVATVCGNW